MPILFIAIIALVLFLNFKRNSQHPRLQTIAPYFRTAAIIFFGLWIFTKCFTQINAGNIGVQKLFGKIQYGILPPGLHIINPLLDIIELDARTQNYTMSGVHDEGKKSGDDAIRALTKDGLELNLDITALYRIIPESAPEIINKIGLDYEEKVIRPIVRTKIRDYAVYYEAVELYSNKRDEFQQRIYKSVETDLQSRGLILEQLLVRNIALPDRVKSAIEEKISAEQEAQKMQFVLQKEKQEAERKRVEAQGIADYQKIINTGLTSQQIQYELIKAYKELAQSQNAKVIIMDGKTAPIMLNSN